MRLQFSMAGFGCTAVTRSCLNVCVKKAHLLVCIHKARSSGAGGRCWQLLASAALWLLRHPSPRQDQCGVLEAALTHADLHAFTVVATAQAHALPEMHEFSDALLLHS